MIQTAVYDTKPYDREYLQATPAASRVAWHFHDFHLKAGTASTAAGCTAVCVFVHDILDAACIELLAKAGVRLIALRCAGFNNVDLKAAEKYGIKVTRVPAYSPHAVAEYAVGLFLTLNRKIHRSYTRTRELNFSLQGLVGFDVAGKTIGIIGTGKIGKLTAEIFSGFKARILAYDPFPAKEWAEQNRVQYISYEQLLAESDIISLHLPLTPESLHMINETAISKMKKGAFLINTSRGKLIDTAALIQALKSGQLGGVALDVYEEEEGVFYEDLSDKMLADDELSRLLTFPNVLITSHQAFLTREALREIARVTAENIVRFTDQQPFLADCELA